MKCIANCAILGVLLVCLALSGGAAESASPEESESTYNLEFSTFLGGSGQDQIRDVGTDTARGTSTWWEEQILRTSPRLLEHTSEYTILGSRI